MLISGLAAWKRLIISTFPATQLGPWYDHQETFVLPATGSLYVTSWGSAGGVASCARVSPRRCRAMPALSAAAPFRTFRRGIRTGPDMTPSPCPGSNVALRLPQRDAVQRI